MREHISDNTFDCVICQPGVFLSSQSDVTLSKLLFTEAGNKRSFILIDIL